MSRRPSGNTNTGVSLFPFLAVLLCTMGALILLLMLIAQQARSQAEAEAERQAKLAAAQPQIDAEAEQKRDDLEWKVNQLTAAREKSLAGLAEHRSRLAHLEEHAQRLQRQLNELAAAEALLGQQSEAKTIDRAQLEAELARLNLLIAEAQDKLAKAKAAGQKPQAFAVVPYEGRNGTRRRPIYIECRGDAVVLQPEGIVFRESDFLGSLGPSNALASCVRVVGEYVSRGSSYQEGEQPYPLLLVRPSGIGAYYAARAAMQSWDSDFGYELINEDWPLEFPAPDPLLSQMLTKTVEEARARQVMIARAAPSLREKRQKVSFQLAPGGRSGVEPVPGTTDDDSSGTGGPYASGPGFGPGSGGNGPSGGQPAGSTAAGYSDNRYGTGTGGGAAAAGAPGYPTDGQLGGSPGAGAQGFAGADGGAPSAGFAGSNQGAGDSGPKLGEFVEGGGNRSREGGTMGTGGPGGESRYGSGSFAEGSASGGSSGTSASGAPGGMSGGAAGTSSAGTSAGGVASADGATPSASVMVPPPGPGEYVESMARKRGKNWGLPESSRSSTPLTRPIQMYCAADSLTLFSDRGVPDKQIPLAGRTEDSVDALVNQVWDHVKAWGLAGRGMYWKPILSVHVAPDGAARFNELKQLLEGSGLEVTGKQITVASPAGPSNRR